MGRRLETLPWVLTSIVTLAACQTRDAQSAKAADTLMTVMVPREPLGKTTDDTIASDAGARTGASSSGGETLEYYTAVLLAHVGDSLARGSSTGHMLRGHPTYQYLQIRRAKSGVPEIHDRWTDVTMVQAGRAMLLSGGRVSGSHAEPGGEHRGGIINGGSSRPVATGDLMIIPAGIPHQYVIAAGDSLRYLTVKVLRTTGPH